MTAKRTQCPPKKFSYQIRELKAARRKDVIKGLAGLAVITAVILIDRILKTNSFVSEYNIPFENLMILVAMGLSMFTGGASIDFVNKGKTMKKICKEYDIAKDDIV